MTQRQVTQEVIEADVAGATIQRQFSSLIIEVDYVEHIEPEAPPTETPPPVPPPLPGPQPEPTPFPAGEYKVVIADLLGNPLEEVPALNVNFSYILNAPGSCSFSLHTREPKCTKAILYPGQRVIHVYRAGALVWGGYLWSAVPGMDTVQFGGEGWWSRIRRRIVTDGMEWTDVDQFQIARDLLNYTQSQPDGDLGIVPYSDTDLSGVTVTDTIYSFDLKNIGEKIEQLSARQDGFDFDITPDRKWRTFYPKKGGRINHVFELGKNISGISYQFDASNTATEVWSGGSGIIAHDSDSIERSRYGLLQDRVDFPDVSLQSTLDRHVIEQLRILKAARLQPEIAISTDDPRFGLYTVGDEARVRAEWGYIDLDDFFRIISIVVAISNEGREAITIFFDSKLAT